MRFYLIDDDRQVQNILKIIIRDRSLGVVCGTAENPVEALSDLSLLEPDIVIVDLLMPEMDGITFIEKARDLCPDITFVMLSQVSSKDMVGRAYESGAHFYIQKPINAVEVENVIKRIIETLSMKKTFSEMQSLFMNSLKTPAGPSPEKKYLRKITNILQQLGISGEIGSKDILSIVEFLVEHGKTADDYSLTELCGNFGDNPKSVEQRVRRAAQTGLSNLAHMGLEDYNSDIFTEYAASLFLFEQVRKEMDYIRGKGDRHGNVKIKNFLNALMLYSQS